VAGWPPDAFEAALAWLRQKERATAEVVAWLAGRGYAAEEIEAQVARLTEIGELDDERFARRYAEDKRELRGWGPERIREALSSRGVASDLVEMALEADSHDAQVRRASDLLARRGYEYEVAYEAVRTAGARPSPPG
jgi:regulatory protein